MLFFFWFLQNHLKDILASVVSRRKAYRVRDGHFKYAFGSNVTPQPYLRNSIMVYNSLIERCVPGLRAEQFYFFVLFIRPFPQICLD